MTAINSDVATSGASLAATDAAIDLIVCTIGRPAALTRLLESIERGRSKSLVSVILVDQSGDDTVTDTLAGLQLSFPIRHLTSPRGLSAGRNLGLEYSAAPVVAFPDDDCWYDEGSIEDALRFLERKELDGVSGIQATEGGVAAGLRWPAAAENIDRRNFFRTAISSGVFLRAAAVRAVGGFNTDFGLGSKQWQAGEESDLILRLIEAGYTIRYDPSVVVRQSDHRVVTGQAMANRHRAYGAAMGQVWRRHRLSAGQLSVIAARKFANAALCAGKGNFGRSRIEAGFGVAVMSGYLRKRPPAKLVNVTIKNVA
jgi:glycosyltransferase involved in cell wall biosynthesis